MWDSLVLTYFWQTESTKLWHPLSKRYHHKSRTANTHLKFFGNFYLPSQEKLLFTMDITSLYTVISNDKGPLTLKHFLDHLIGPIGANHNHAGEIGLPEINIKHQQTCDQSNWPLLRHDFWKDSWTFAMVNIRIVLYFLSCTVAYKTIRVPTVKKTFPSF